jgi:hypothetical protein
MKTYTIGFICHSTKFSHEGRVERLPSSNETYRQFLAHLKLYSKIDKFIEPSIDFDSEKFSKSWLEMEEKIKEREENRINIVFYYCG